MASKEKEEMFLTCEVCDLPFTGFKPFEQHMKGKQHKKQVDDKKRQMKLKPPDGDSCVEETKDSDADVYSCALCETAFSGIIPYTQHLKGKHHTKVVRRKNVEDDTTLVEGSDSDSELPDDDADLTEILSKILQKPYMSCSICEKKFSGPESYLLHIKGNSHAKRKAERQLLEKIKAVIGTSEVSEEQKEVKCKDCDRVFCGAVSFAQHLTGKSHAKNTSRNEVLKELKALMELEDDSSSSEDEESSEVLICEICNKGFSGPESLKAHIQSKKHRKAIQWKRYLAKKDKYIENDSRVQTSLKEKDGIEKTCTKPHIDSSEKTESYSAAVEGDKHSTTAT